MAYNIFQLVLDFQRDPSHFEALIGQEKPLPKDTGKLLEKVAGKAVPEADSDTSGDELFSATVFFVERVLFMPGGSLYRQLGLDQNATQEQIRKHYHLLMHLFMLDREDMAANWSVEYADCINQAYSVLRDSVKRRAYDARLFRQETEVNGQITHGESSKSLTHSVVSFAKNRDQNQTGQRAEDEEGNGVYGQLSHSTVAKTVVDPSENVAIHPETIRVTEENSFIADSIERAYSDIGAHAAQYNDGKEPHFHVRGFASDELHKNGHGGIKPIRVEDDFDQTVEGAYRRRSRGKSSSRTVVFLIVFIVILGAMAAIYEYQSAPGTLTPVIKSTPEIADIPAAEVIQQQLLAPEPEDNIIAGFVEVDEKPAIEEGATEVIHDVSVRLAMVEDNLPKVAADSAVESRQQESEVVEKADKPLQVVAASSVVKENPQEEVTIITGLSPSRSLQLQPDKEVLERPVLNQESVLAHQEVKESLWEPVVKKEKHENAAIAKSSAAPASQINALSSLETEVFPPPEMTAPAVKTPLAELDVGVVASLAPLPEPVSEPEPAPQVLEPKIHRIPEGDLKNMIRTFVRSYEEGDLKVLLSVFAEDARTNDRNDRNGIAEDYRGLFEVAEKRQFIFNDLKWVTMSENHARGGGAFEVKILLKGESMVSTITGRITIDVEKRGKDILITRFFHSYQ